MHVSAVYKAEFSPRERGVRPLLLPASFIPWLRPPFRPPFRGGIHLIFCCLPPVPGPGSWEAGRRTFPTSRERRKGRPRARVSSAAWAAPPELLAEKGRYVRLTTSGMEAGRGISSVALPFPVDSSSSLPLNPRIPFSLPRLHGLQLAPRNPAKLSPGRRCVVLTSALSQGGA